MVILWLFMSVSLSWSQTGGLCDILQIPNCEGVTKQSRRASAQSLPSPVAAGTMNPANVGQDKGLGVEAIYQLNNPLVTGIVAGTGRVGAALISAVAENTFFGNRVPEISQDEFTRRDKDLHYTSDKLNIGTSFALIKRKNVGADLGLMAKRNSKIKKVNPGIGLSARLGPFNAGVSYYHDDFFLKFKNTVNPETGIPYTVEYGSPTYDEKFLVQNLMIGFKIKNLFIDYGQIKTKYKFEQDQESTITILSAAFVYSRFMFNLASRLEKSGSQKYNFQKKLMERKNDRSDFHGGIQYSLNRYIILGAQYNYFLMREASLTATLFF